VKNFKLFRTGSLILALWLFIANLYIVFSGFEKFDCCASNVEGYGLYTFIGWLIDARLAPLMDCACDLENLTTTFYIIPIDLIILDLLFWCVFIYFQFFKKDKK
jgi:hypothetical protein